MCTPRRRGVDVRPDDYIDACHLLSSWDSNLESGVLAAEYTHGVVTQKVETAAQRLTLFMLTLRLVLLWGWDGAWGRHDRDLGPPSVAIPSADHGV